MSADRSVQQSHEGDKKVYNQGWNLSKIADHHLRAKISTKKM
jgi:hypothetical protein